MQSIGKTSNVYETQFLISGLFVSARVWNGSDWVWVRHQALSSFLESQNPHLEYAAVGPHLQFNEVNQGRLFIVSRNSGKYRVFSYSYHLGSLNDHTSLLRPVETHSLDSVTGGSSLDSNLAVDSDWNIYGHGHTVDSGWARLVKFNHEDLFSNNSAFTPSQYVHTNFRPTASAAYVSSPNSQLHRLPVIGPENHIFWSSNGRLFSTPKTLDQGVVLHRGKRIYDIGPELDRGVYCIKHSGNIFDRWYDRDRNQWRWTKHRNNMGLRYGNPIIRGSMSKLSDSKLVMCGNRKDGSFILEHWRDHNRNWHWADHGFPSEGRPQDIGLRKEDRFFVLLEGNQLAQRVWSPSAGEWVWDIHGSIPTS